MLKISYMLNYPINTGVLFGVVNKVHDFLYLCRGFGRSELLNRLFWSKYGFQPVFLHSLHGGFEHLSLVVGLCKLLA